MTVISKTAGILSALSALNDIHKTSKIYSSKEYQKASSDTFIATSIGCQKTNNLSYKDTKRKNWTLRHAFFVGINESIASVRGYLKGAQEGFLRYFPNFVLTGLAIIPNKNHKILANISAAALGVLEVYDYLTNGSNMGQRTDYLE